MSADFQSCRLQISPPSATLSLRRPPLHVLDLSAIGELSRALDDVAERPEVMVLILTSLGGRAFSAGVEVRDHLPERLDEMLETFHDLCRRLIELPALTVAAVKGPALGGGMELAACCDFVIASENASFSHPEIDVGCFPPFGASLYPALFGARRAKEIVLLGERFSAAEARELGLVNRVVRESELDSAVAELVSRIIQKSPAALRLAKKALRLATDRALETLPEIEAIYSEELAATEDMIEGLQAFLEKRKPVWKGR
ncbi:MAG: enoyl-CoA hydratase/isomerase family protein [Vicinamibacteria bacterium]